MTIPAESMASLQVLGPVALHRDTGVSSVPQLTQPRPLAVLTYLVLARPRRLHSRDTLLALLWPDTGQVRGRHALRNVLHSIRKAIGDAALVAGGDGLVGVAPGSIRCDALEVEELVHRKEWEAALSLYQGDLLTGFHVGEAAEFEEWLSRERSRFRQMMVMAAGALATARQEAGDLPGAIRAAERRVQLDPNEESGHRQLMQLLALHGERAAARRVYGRLEDRVRAEYGTTPSRETRELLATLMDSAASRLPILEDPGAETGEEGSGKDESSPERREIETGRWTRRWYLAAGAVALILGTGVVVARRAGRAGPAPVPTLFVAPVVNATGDSTATWLDEGFTISLRDQFRRAGWLLVPESRVKRALREHPTPEAAAGAVGAALLLMGRTDSAAGRVRLHLAVTPAEQEQPAALAEALVQPNRLLDAELEVVRSVIEQLRPDLAADSVVAALRRGTSDDAAYRFFLQGWYLWDRRYTLTDMQQAAVRFDSALAHDPVYPDALAARARVRFALAWSGYGAEQAGLAAARADARRALELDSTSRVALSVLGAVETFHDSAAARRLLERAVALDPDRSDTFFLLGLHYGFRGEYAIAERAYRRARELDPLVPFLYSRLVAVQVCQGAFERALESIAQWRDATARPELLRAIDYREASLLLVLGRWREAIPMFQRVMSPVPDLAAALGRAQSVTDLLAVLRRAASRPEAAEAVVFLTEQRPGAAGAHRALRSGHREEAIRRLVEARAAGDVTLPMVCEDPVLQPLMRVPEVALAMRLAQSPW